MKKATFWVLAFAFLARLAGLWYGLPLWLVDDEPPFVLAALKMLELKTVLPVFHLAAFQSVLYYPPYFSYLLLPLFVALAGVKFLLFTGPSALFSSYLLSDLSWFFAAARLLSTAASVFAVYLLYKTGEHLFKEKTAGLAAAFFAATSLIEVALSMTGRHWAFVFLTTSLVLYALSHPTLSEKRKYLFAALSAGVGVGFAIVNAFSALLIALWFLLYEKKSAREALRSTFYSGIALLFSFLALLPVLLYPKGLGFTADTTARSAKTVFEALFSPLLFANTILISEPVLLLFALIGLCALWKRARNLFWTTGVYLFLYSVIFYMLFRFEQRFLMGLLPLYFILAGYGFAFLWERTPRRVWRAGLLLLLAVPLALTLRLSYLAFQGDTRSLAATWAREHIPLHSKVLVLARLTALPTDTSALAEQEALDPASIRKVNRAQADMSEHGFGTSFHALNLADVKNEAFFRDIDAYAMARGYEYLLLQPTYPRAEAFASLASRGKLLASYAGVPRQTTPCQACGSAPTILSVAESQFIANPFLMFTVTELGPPVEIYKLP